LLTLYGFTHAASGAVSDENSEKPAVKTEGAARPSQPERVDPRHRSPRATARTFFIAMNAAEDDPERIVDAIACLDIPSLQAAHRDAGRLAFELETILRALRVPTPLMSDDPNGSEYEIGHTKDLRVSLRKRLDGRWLFDAKTLAAVPQMRRALWQQTAAADGGKSADDVPAGYRSPFALAHTFIDAFKQEDLNAAATCLDLSEIPDPARGPVGRELAFKLKQVLDRTVFVVFQDLPDTAFGLPLEALVHPDGRITIERQVAGPRKGQWLFNRATVRSLDRLYDVFESNPLVPELAENGRNAGTPRLRLVPALWLRQRVPGVLKTRIGVEDVLSFALYQVLGVVLLLLLVAPVYIAVVRPLRALYRLLLRWRGCHFDEREIASWSRPVGWLAVVALVNRVVTMLAFETTTAGAILLVLVPAFWFLVALALYRQIDPTLRLIAGPDLLARGATTFATMGYPVVSLVLKILVVVAGLSAVLKLFNFDVGTVLAGLGIGGLAFALAAQDTLKNFFGSIMLIADRTFRVGDLVKIGDNEGVVELVGLRTTRIRGLDDALLTIPNSDLTTAHVTNFGARRFRRFRTQIVVPFGTTNESLVQFREGLLQLLRDHPNVRREKYEVAVNDLQSSGVEVLIEAYLQVDDRHAELVARDALVLQVLGLAHDLGIDLPTDAHDSASRGRPNK
jgi:MscS family membrane protein